MGSEAPKAKVDAAVEALNQTLNLFEEKFLQNKPFIAGDKISVADLVAIVEIMQPAATGIKVFEGRPKLTAWRERVKKEVSENLFDEAHEQLMNLGSVMQKLDSKDKMERLKTKYRKIFG